MGTLDGVEVPEVHVQGERRAENKNSTLLVLAVACLVSFDYAPIFLTLWPYMEWLGGSYKLYSLASAMYGLARIPVAPLLSILADKTTLKPAFLLCIAAFIIGNLVYVLASKFANTWFAIFLVFFARFMSGVGGSAVPVVMSYLTLISKPEERVHYFNQFRISQFLGNTIGPIIATACLFIPAGYVLGVMFNAATIPALLTCAFAFIIFTPTLMFLVEPERTGNRSTMLDVFKSDCLRDALYLNLSFLVGLFSLSLLSFQLIPIATTVFHIAYLDFKWVWLAYISFFVGFMISAILTKLTINKYPGFTDSNFMVFSLLFIAAGWVGFIQWKTYLPIWLYYVASTLIFMGWGLFMVSHRAVYARVTEPSGYPTSFMALLSIAGSVAMCVAPLFEALFLDIVDNDDPEINQQCVDLGFEAGKCCDAGSNTYCCCKMTGLTFVSCVSIVTLLLATAFQFYLVRIRGVGKLPDTQELESPEGKSLLEKEKNLTYTEEI